MQTDIAAAIAVAQRFGNLVARTDYPAAHALLTAEARKVCSPSEIRWKLESMTACMVGTIHKVELEEAAARKDWPEKQEGDIASVGLRFIGDVFEEAVTVILVKEAEAIRIRDLEWGRPLSIA